MAVIMYGVLDRKKGFYIGCGYGGPRKAVPYWDRDLQQVKLYRSRHAAWTAAKKFGGRVCGVTLNPETGKPEEYLGLLLTTWRTELQDAGDPEDRAERLEALRAELQEMVDEEADRAGTVERIQNGAGAVYELDGAKGDDVDGLNG